MTNEYFAADEFCEGVTAARAGKPFDDWTSKPWQQGWTFHHRRQALRELGALEYGIIHSALEAIALAIGMLSRRSTVVAELTRSVALRALEGDDIARDAHPATEEAVELVAQ